MQDMCYPLGDIGDPEGARFRLGVIFLAGRAREKLSAAEVTELLTLHAGGEPRDGKPVITSRRIRGLDVHIVTSSDRKTTAVFAFSPKDL